MNDLEFKKENLLEAGVNLGDLVKSWNPKMGRYEITKSNPPKSYPNPQAQKIHIFDAQKVIDCFLHTKSQIEELVEKYDKPVLFLGTSSYLAEIINQAAISCNSPYLVHRWVGVFLTNFEVVSQNIIKLKKLIFVQNSKKFATFSKKSQAEIEQKINKLKKTYEGVLDLPIDDKQFHIYCPLCQEKITITRNQLERWKGEVKKQLTQKLKEHLIAIHPEEEVDQRYFKLIEPFEKQNRVDVVLFIIRLKKEKTALKEAKDSRTPVLAICNTSNDPDLIDHVILGNDWNKKSVNYLVNAVAEIIRKSKLKKSGGVLEKETSTKEQQP